MEQLAAISSFFDMVRYNGVSMTKVLCQKLFMIQFIRLKLELLIQSNIIPKKRKSRDIHFKYKGQLQNFTFRLLQQWPLSHDGTISNNINFNSQFGHGYLTTT